MLASLEFILGLLDREDPAQVAAEDLDGLHGPALRLWQALGFLDRAPGWHPIPSCPFCWEGAPYLLHGRYLCSRCHSTVDPRHLVLWRFERAAFLAWLSRRLRLRGRPQQIDERLWLLGSFLHADQLHACFFCRTGPLSAEGQRRLLAYRNAILLRPLPSGEPATGFRGPCLSLLEILRQDRRSLTAADITTLLRGTGAVRFEEESGAVFAGDVFLGDVPVGAKEYHLLACLWQQMDRFVPYSDLKHYVLRQSGSTDSTEEATFCQGLKSRIKKKWVPKIDLLVATTNKGDGYRLRGFVEV
jgi:hypothetical protein